MIGWDSGVWRGFRNAALSILKRCHTCDAAERTDKCGWMFKADLKADFQKRQTLTDQGLAHADPPLSDVIGNCGVEMLFEKTGHIFSAVVKMFCYLTYRGDFGKVYINILLQFKNLIGQEVRRFFLLPVVLIDQVEDLNEITKS